MIVENSFFKLTLCEKTGRIISYQDRFGMEYISSFSNTPLISIRIMDENGGRLDVTSAFEVQMTVSRNVDDIVLSYKNFGGQNLNVTAYIKCLGASIEWRLDVENNTGCSLEWINYPGILLNNKLKNCGGDFKLFLPIFEGVEITDYRLRNENFKYYDIDYPSKGWEGRYPGSASMQFMAYYNGINGLYVGAHDEEHYVKGIDANQLWSGLLLDTKLFTGSNDKYFSYNFPYVTEVFDGGFYEAANIYRNFIFGSSHVNIPKIVDNNKIANWLKDSPIVVIYPIRGEKDTGDVTPNEYYPYTNALPTIEKLAEKTKSRLLVLLCQWESTAPWCPPYVWPPYGDTENFKKYSEELHKLGHLFGLYCSGIAWTQKSIFTTYNKEKEFEKENLKEEMCKAPDQSLPYCIICNDYIRWGYDMCASSKKVIDIMKEETYKMVSGCELDYLQLFDQNLGGSPSLCYAKNHGHSHTPGKWETTAMRNLISEVEEVANENKNTDNVMLGCEAAASEGYLDKFILSDARNYQGFAIGKPVPAYNYIYHEYISNFMGNQNTTYVYLEASENQENIFYRTGHLFAQGDLLTIVLKNDGKVNWDLGTPWKTIDVKQEMYLSFVKELNEWRKGGLKAELQYGKMSEPYKISCGTYDLKFRNGKINTLPSIITTCYEVDKTTKCQVVVNYSEKEQEFEIDFGAEKEVFVIDNPTNNSCEKQTLKGKKKLQIKPYKTLKILVKE